MSMNEVKLSAKPLYRGRISPMLYGGFIELLDDLVPGMWAEILNDRSFEGVGPAVKWCYYTGRPNFCDREWQTNDTWAYDAIEPFNGARSVKLTASRSRPAVISQSGLAVRRGMSYIFSGWSRTDSTDLSAAVHIKTLLPDGNWMVLSSAQIPISKGDWSRFECKIASIGTTDRAVFEIEVEGEGNLWADKLSLMPSDNVAGWRRDVVEAVKAQHPGVIRWGGSIVDPGGYKWKQGIGSRDRRVPFPDPYWGRKHSNDVGIDEFLQFCELVQAKPIVCMSFADGVESARDLLQYCNGGIETEWGRKRVENGHAEPYNVRYWQIGNELAGEEYSTGCVDFCKMIRQEQPDAVILSSDPTHELFDKVGKYIDVTCPHHYSDDLAADEASIERALEIIRGAGLDHEVKLGITEWNVSAGSWGLTRGKQCTLDSALFAARYMNLLHHRSDAVILACRSNMTNSYCSGMIQTDASSLVLTPSYHTLKLYALHSKPVPIVVEGAPEGVDISACASEDMRSLCIFAVNMSREPVQIKLDLSEYSPGFQAAGGEVVCDTLNRGQTDIMNHFEAPDRIRTVGLAVSSDGVTLPALSVAAIECKAP